MRRILALCALALCLLPAAGQNWTHDPALEAALKEDILRAGNNNYTYHHGDLRDTPPPAGYKPFYISHYSRHGSRHTWGSDYYVLILDVLHKADSLGILSDGGRAALEETQQVFDAWGGMDARLSQRGVREHSGIGARMVKRFPAVFRGSPEIRASASVSQRCIISMNAFTTAVSAARPKTRWYLDTGEALMEYIGATGHKLPICKELAVPMKEHLWDAPCDSTYILGTLFTDAAAARGLITDLARFNKALYRTATIAPCWDIEERILPLMQFEYLYRYCAYEASSQYANYGSVEEIDPQRLDSAHQLVDDIVAKADEAIAGGKYAVDLRFGHDYPLLTLVSYLGVEGPGSRMPFSEIASRWWCWRELCMGSNLQMIFYRNRAGRVLVKFLYQEQERSLRNLQSVSGPYYDWETVKANIQGYRR